MTLRQSVAEVLAEGCPVVFNCGLGLVVAPGRVLTSAHVVAGSPKVSVMIDGRRSPATVVAFDSDNDLAVLKTTDPAPFIPIGHASGSATGALFVWARTAVPKAQLGLSTWPLLLPNSVARTRLTTGTANYC